MTLLNNKKLLSDLAYFLASSFTIPPFKLESSGQPNSLLILKASNFSLQFGFCKCAKPVLLVLGWVRNPFFCVSIPTTVFDVFIL